MGISNGIITKAARITEGFNILQRALSSFQYKNVC